MSLSNTPFLTTCIVVIFIADSERFHPSWASLYRVEPAQNLCHMLSACLSTVTGARNGGEHRARILHRCNKTFFRAPVSSTVSGAYQFSLRKTIFIL